MTELEQFSEYEIEKIHGVVCGDSLFDGVISEQSQRLKNEFNAIGFNITRLWVLTPQNWICPACGRSKSQIVKLDQHQNLWCWIVEHHDHMKEIIKQKFFEISVAQHKIVADSDAEAFAIRSCSMISAFDNVAICGDCNSADTNAKKLISAHPDFSFSSFEIADFVIANPNVPHSINIEKAQRIWEANKNTFELRLKIAERIAHYGATNNHWYQNIPLTQRADYFHRQRVLLSGRVFDLLIGPKREQPIKHHSEWRKVKNIVGRDKPAANVVAHVKSVRAKAWKQVDESWCCPICNRSKEQLVRKNNKGEWSILLRNSYFWNSNSTYCKERLYVCNDCFLAGQKLVQETFKIIEKEYVNSAFTALITTKEVAMFVLPKANNRHTYDNNNADTVIELILSRIESLPKLKTNLQIT